MSDQRSTFSESWHRVAVLRPRLSPAVSTSRQRVRGRVWHFLRDPWTHDTYRLHEAGYQFVGLLDGRRTVEDAWDICNATLGDASLTQPEVIELLAWLHMSNLLQGDLPPDASQLLYRQTKRKRAERGQQLLSVMSFRIPLFDPDEWLNRWAGLFGFAFSRIGFALWVVLLMIGIGSVLGRGEELWLQGSDLLTPTPLNLLMLYGSFVFIKLLHEVGHGVACKRFARMAGDAGGVHGFGVMFLVLLPIPYVDVSSSWLLRSKWHRAAISAGGMYFELAAAAVAAVIWSQTGPGAIHNVAYQLMFWASVTTFLFNANPLLRFDGYYILSDVLEIPNLDMRSRGYVSYLVKRYLFGVKQVTTMAHTTGEQFWLPIYFSLAWTYRVLLIWGIILFVGSQFSNVGLLLIAIAMIGWIVVPLSRGINYLATSPQLNRRRVRAVCITSALIVPAVLGFMLIPAPDWAAAQGVAEPVRFAEVYPREAGFVRSVLPSHTLVTPGRAPLISLENDELQLEIRTTELELAQRQTNLRKAEAENAADVDRLRREIEVLVDRLNWQRERASRLAVQPELSGVWLCYDWDSLEGAFVWPTAEQPLGRVVSLDQMYIRVAADQAVGPRLATETSQGQLVRVRPAGHPDKEFKAVIDRIIPAGQRELPSASLGTRGGGTLATATDATNQVTAAEPIFELILVPNPEDLAEIPAILPGQRFEVRFDFEPSPMGQQLVRSLFRVVQRRFQIQL